MSSTPVIDHELARETARRRTCAIISHPDAGKTTLTEKLLLYSGLVRSAGMVKKRKGRQLAASDWMGMEQERGISITSSAMQFTYKDAVVNVLDTPGHQDFSEDTYRTLTAADSAIMVLDAGKGVEAQTRKLFPVCRLRGVPVLTFINKMDMPGREPLDLLAEVEEVLGIQTAALFWPIGTGREFVGVVDRRANEALIFRKTAAAGSHKADVERFEVGDPRLVERVGPLLVEQMRNELELLDGAGNAFTVDSFLRGETTPAFFGSALTNFGVEPFFDAFVELAPCPGPRPVDLPNGEKRLLDPVAEPFSGFVFKIQSNMDPKHRDALAFVRVCSGRYERELPVKHHRIGKTIRLAAPHSIVARQRNTVDEAFPGDVVGFVNRDTLRIGDTLSVRGGFEHEPPPQFQPEVFARVAPKDASMRKRFDKGLGHLIAEGAIQEIHIRDDVSAQTVVAAVGTLQFDVLQFRLKEEYGVETSLTRLPYACSAWLEGPVETFKLPSQSVLARDARDRCIVLFSDLWEKRYAGRENPGHRLLDHA